VSEDADALAAFLAMGGELGEEDYLAIVTRWRDENIHRQILCRFVHVDPYAINMPKTGLVYLGRGARARFVPGATVCRLRVPGGHERSYSYTVPVTLPSSAFMVTWAGQVTCFIDVDVLHNGTTVLRSTRWELVHE